MTSAWRVLVRSLRFLVGCLLPGPIAANLLRDLDEAHHRRQATDLLAAGAYRWYARQLVSALLPWRLAALHRADRQSRHLAFRGRAARHESGSLLLRAIRGVGHVLGDLRHSVRSLASAPVFSALTISVLAGGLAVSIFTFSLLHTAMFKPLPLPEGDSIVRILATRDGWTQTLDAADLAAIRPSIQTLSEIGTFETRPVLIRGEAESRSQVATVIEPGVFEFTRSRPALGRGFNPEDGRDGAEPVAVLSHLLWQTAFGGDPEIVNELVEMNSVPTRVIGVMPQGYGFPVFATLWLPLSRSELQPLEHGTRYLSAYARLQPGVSEREATAELRTLIQGLRQDEPAAEFDDERATGATVRTFQLAQMGDEGMLMFGLLNMIAGFILLLAWINATNLLLSRAVEKGREMTIRVALGAPRLRLVAQMMGESVLVCAVGGGIAIAGAGWALGFFDRVAHAALPEGLAFWWNWGLDSTTTLAAIASVLATIVFVGAVPAWRATRADSSAVLRDGPQGGQGLVAGRTTRVLVVAQVALISVLMFAGGLSATMSYRAANFDLGFDAEHVVVAGIQLPADRYDTADKRWEFYERLRSSLEPRGAIEGTVLRSRIETGSGSGFEFRVEGAEYETALQQPQAYMTAISGSPAHLGIRLLAGRYLDRTDVAGGAPTAVVSETLARESWPESSPLGRRISLGTVEDQPEWRTVVGVVSDVVEGNPMTRDQTSLSIYLPLAQATSAGTSVNLKHSGEAAAAVSALYRTLEELDRDVLPTDVRDFDEMFSTISGMASTGTNVIVGCFLFSLLLAVSGIYGLASRSVTQRTHEIGVRRALGASEARIVGLFLRHGGRQLAVGLGIATSIAGVVGFGIARYLALEVTVWVSLAAFVPTVISGIVLLATYLPTRRAIRLEPGEALWRE